MDRHQGHLAVRQQRLQPEGVRVGGEGGQKKALKVWEKREFKNLDDTVELGTRNIKVALRRLRKFARTGADENSTSTTPSAAPPRTRACSTSRWCPSATTR